LLFRSLLANLPHGGSPPYGNPIFRSGEVCRHSIFNSYADIPPFLACLIFALAGSAYAKNDKGNNGNGGNGGNNGSKGNSQSFAASESISAAL
jgi:hypothetical protein